VDGTAFTATFVILGFLARAWPNLIVTLGVLLWEILSSNMLEFEVIEGVLVKFSLLILNIGISEVLGELDRFTGIGDRGVVGERCTLDL
jgi:hypothetical protein